MESSIDRSLDDRTLRNKQHFSSQPRRRPANPFVDRRGPPRPSPYPLPPRPPVTPAPVIVGGNPAAGTKLYLSNLDYGVSNDDIKLLFSIVGPLKRYGIHYDKSGRSKGTAEVVFERQVDAITAIKRYNNVNLDGKPIRIELVGVNVVAPLPMPVPDHSSLVKSKPSDNYTRTGATHSSVFERVGTSQDRGNGRARSHGNLKGQGGGRHFNTKKKLTTEDLDAELERYHMDARAR